MINLGFGFTVEKFLFFLTYHKLLNFRVVCFCVCSLCFSFRFITVFRVFSKNSIHTLVALLVFMMPSVEVNVEHDN